MSRLPAGLQEVLDRADGSVVRGGLRAVSVSTGRVRAWLRFRGLPWLEPGVPEPPPLGALDATARVVIERSAVLATALGGGAALGGLALVPSEAALSGVLTLRMVQRLCVVYGFELESDRGEDALTRALAAAYGVALPPGGVRHLRASDLPRVLRGRTAPTELGATLVRAVARGTLSWAASRVSRVLPLVSVPGHAADARRATEQAGARAMGVLRRLAEVTDGTEHPVEDAIVLAR